MSRLRRVLPLANALVDLFLLELLAWRPPQHFALRPPAQLTMIAAGTLPAGVASWTLLGIAPARWIWFHEGLALLVWWGVGAWCDAGRPGARRVFLLYLGLRALSAPLSLVPSAAGFASLILAMFWISAVLVLGRQLISRFRRA